MGAIEGYTCTLCRPMRLRVTVVSESQQVLHNNTTCDTAGPKLTVPVIRLVCTNQWLCSIPTVPVSQNLSRSLEEKACMVSMLKFQLVFHTMAFEPIKYLVTNISDSWSIWAKVFGLSEETTLMTLREIQCVSTLSPMKGKFIAVTNVINQASGIWIHRFSKSKTFFPKDLQTWNW